MKNVSFQSRLSINILCIETSTDVCSVCISRDDEIMGLNEFKEFRHSSHLLPLILSSLEEAGMPQSDLDAICISKGPGSYTGLRVGASTAKGWAFALDLPLLGIDTLLSLANGLLLAQREIPPHSVIMPMIDARRNEVYTSLYTLGLECLFPTQPMILDESFLDFISEERDYYICGNGAHKAAVLTQNMNNVHIIPTEATAHSLCALSQKSYSKKAFEILDHFEPNYLKAPNITKSKSQLQIKANL
ncbi:MAG: tRNA (adenosine(37)-N6)-threonylcarbamoyltransferase complex dimerization subunit type 1 TsaB [Saprospiraceae bacterium]